MTINKVKPAARHVVPLSDLTPRVDLKGGAGRRVFGADAGSSGPPTAVGSIAPASSPKAPPKRKG